MPENDPNTPQAALGAATGHTEKLFVYGIFLDEYMRNSHGMTNPHYSTVPGYLTVGHGIVQAMPVNDQSIALTGLLVDMDSSRWGPLDRLEGGYDRVKVTTYDNTIAWMYVSQRQYGEE